MSSFDGLKAIKILKVSKALTIIQYTDLAKYDNQKLFAFFLGNQRMVWPYEKWTHFTIEIGFDFSGGASTFLRWNSGKNSAEQVRFLRKICQIIVRISFLFPNSFPVFKSWDLSYENDYITLVCWDDFE